MEVSGQHHWPLYLQERTPVSIQQECGGASESVYMFWSKEKFLAPTGIQTQNHPACSLVTIPTELLQLHEKFMSC